MRYRLRTLLIVLALGPMVLWGGYSMWIHHMLRHRGGYHDGHRWHIVPAPKAGYHPVSTDNGYIMVPDNPPPQE